MTYSGLERSAIAAHFLHAPQPGINLSNLFTKVLFLHYEDIFLKKLRKHVDVLSGLPVKMNYQSRK
jgi:hypothetical protein